MLGSWRVVLVAMGRITLGRGASLDPVSLGSCAIACDIGTSASRVYVPDQIIRRPRPDGLSELKADLMIASLMMYARPELEEAHRRYWRLIHQALKDAGMDSPQALSQEADEFFVWKHPELVLSQTCGMPYRLWLQADVELVGTPDFGLKGCPPGYYRSALVIRGDDPRTDVTAFRDAVFAYNETFSQSGYAAPFAHMEPVGFWFQNRLHTGQHLGSARAVAEGRADIAALDAVTWLNIESYEAVAQKLRVLVWTRPTPGLPLITAKGNDRAVVFNAVQQAIAGLNAQDRTALRLKGIVDIPKEDYLSVPNPTCA